MIVISIYNDSTSRGDDDPNYTYRVASGPNIIAAGQIVGFDPRAGWPLLLQAVAEQGAIMAQEMGWRWHE